MKYAGDLKTSLEQLVDTAKGGQLDIERLIWELHKEEVNRAHSARQAQGRVKKWRREIAKFAPALRSPLTRLAARDEVSKAEALAENSAKLARIEEDVYKAFRRSREELLRFRALRLRAYRAEFETYLASLLQGNSSVAAATARWAWNLLRKDLPAPECSPSEDGVLLVWDNGPHHCQFAASHSGHYDWFYRNRETEQIDGEEDLHPNNLSARFLGRVQEFRSWP